MLLETIEKGNLGKKNISKKCSRKEPLKKQEESESEVLTEKSVSISAPTDECIENHMTAETESSVSV
jgi:hypothetical protein